MEYTLYISIITIIKFIENKMCMYILKEENMQNGMESTTFLFEFPFKGLYKRKKGEADHIFRFVWPHLSFFTFPFSRYTTWNSVLYNRLLNSRVTII